MVYRIIEIVDQPLVSVLMNCYNGEEYLREAIDSIYAQTYKNWEIVFIDNCSTDGSEEIVRSYDHKIKYFKTPMNLALGTARNFGLGHCEREYIAFLDVDDLYLPHKLECQVKLIHDSNLVMCYGSASVIDENGKYIRKNIVKNKSGDVFPSLLRHYEINMQTVMLERKFLIENQLSFNTNMSYCPDHNLFMTIASRANVGVIPEILAKYRVVSNSLSSKTITIAPKEFLLTLNELSKTRPELQRKFAKEFSVAYDKAMYYEVVANIYNNDKRQARINLKTIRCSRIEYLLLYLLLFTPVSNKFILKLLNR